MMMECQQKFPVLHIRHAPVDLVDADELGIALELRKQRLRLL